MAWSIISPAEQQILIRVRAIRRHAGETVVSRIIRPWCPMPSTRAPSAVIFTPEFYNALRRRLRHYVWEFDHTGVELDDLFNEVIVRLHQPLKDNEELHPDQELNRYLLRGLTIAKNHLIDIARKKPALTGLDLSTFPEPAPNDFDWDAVLKTVASIGPPPPAEFARQWYERKRCGEKGTEQQTELWGKQFGVNRSSIHRWSDLLLDALRTQFTSELGGAL